MKQQISDLVRLMFKFPVPWILTGAGISTESGIPDFRSPGSGLWEKLDPMEFSSVEGLIRNPKAFFTHGMETIGTIMNAQPNAGHIVLGDLQQARIVGPPLPKTSMIFIEEAEPNIFMRCMVIFEPLPA